MSDAVQQDATVAEVDAMVAKALNAARQTVGYAECKDRTTFETGAKIALAKMAILTISALEVRSARINNESAIGHAAVEHLKTIARILKEYES